MRTSHVIALVVGLCLAAAPARARREVNYADGFDSYVECISVRQLDGGDDYPGAWEYVYDVYGGSQSWLQDVRIEGFDASQILNVHSDAQHGTGVYQNWDINTTSFDNVFMDQWRYPSYWDAGGGDWVLTEQYGQPADWQYYNEWHVAGEYAGGPGTPPSYYPRYFTVGQVYDDGAMGGLAWESDVISTGLTGLHMTFRVVHPDAPGEIYFETFNNYGYGSAEEVYGYLIGPGMWADPCCDLDGDGDVDTDDIDIICDTMGGDPGWPPDPCLDRNGDGVIDEDDLLLFLAECVEYDIDGDGTPDGVGVWPGDFNLDGVVNATDLAIMQANFGDSGVGYADGNANCDDVVNATDLQILHGSFGEASPPPVPEPVTLGLLSIGAAALLRRKG